MTKEEEEARMSDLFMNAEIPDGSLGVPKHQRDCVSPAKVFHYRVEWVPLSLFHPPELPSSTSPSYVVLGRVSRIHATRYRHANWYCNFWSSKDGYCASLSFFLSMCARVYCVSLNYYKYLFASYM